MTSSENPPTLKIKEFYSGKNILLTGVTGFLGKVLLEKVLRSFPDIGTVYIMVRAKRNETPQFRMQNILASQCFNVLRQQMGGNAAFLKYAEKKIMPISGDLVREGLGLTPEDRQILIDNVHVVVNNAASTSFDDPLHEALNINYFGAMRMLELSKACKNIKAFCHVSTAYVNSNLPYDSVVEEEVYNKDLEVERLVSQIIRQNPVQVKENLKSILNGFPNTYTFCKKLAEISIIDKQGTLPTCIVRPSIVAASLKEPFPGWTDTISALGGPIYFGGLGLLKYMVGNGQEQLDVCAVDQVINAMLIASCNCSNNRQSVEVYNCSSGTINPFYQKNMQDYMNKFYITYPFEQQIRYPRYQFVGKHSNRLVYYDIFQHLPLNTAYHISGLPIVGSTKIQKDLGQLKNIYQKLLPKTFQWTYFESGHWKFLNQKMSKILAQMSKEEQIEFDADVRNIDWPIYFENYMRGIQIYALKQDQVKVEHNLQQILLKNKFSFSDINLSFKPESYMITGNSTSNYEPRIMEKERFEKFIQQIFKQKYQTAGGQNGTELTFENFKLKQQQMKNYVWDEEKVKNELSSLRCQVNDFAVRPTLYLGTKVWPHLFEGLHVDLQGIGKIKNMLNNDKQTRVIFLPINSSITDMFLLNYINVVQDVQLGNSIGGCEDVPKIGFLIQILKYAGVILCKHEQAQYDQNINYTNQSLIEEIVAQNQVTTLYQNKNRFRQGKISQALIPDDSIEWLLRAQEYWKGRNLKVKIVPVAMNYERIFDSKLLSNEMLSGELEDLHFIKLMRMIYNMPTNKLGNVYVKYSEPIDLYQYSDQLSELSFTDKAMKLTEDLRLYQYNQQSITKNSCISASLLFELKPQISFKKILEQYQDLTNLMENRGLKTYISNLPSAQNLKNVVTNLGFEVQGKLTKGAKVNLQGIQKANEKLLSLSYYTGCLAQKLATDSFVAHALHFVENETQALGTNIQISKQRLLEISTKIYEILSYEFIDKNIISQQNFEKVIDHAILQEVLVFNPEDSNQIILARTNKNSYRKLKFMRNLLQAYVDSYFVVIGVLIEIMEQNLQVELAHMVPDLQKAIQEMHYQGSIRFLSSSLIETIQNAFRRFGNLGLCQIKQFEKKEGPGIEYLSVDLKNRPALEKVYSMLETISSVANEPEKIKIVEIESRSCLKPLFKL